MEGDDILTSVLLGAPGGEGGEARHEEVKAGEGNHVHRQLPQVRVQLAREPAGFKNSYEQCWGSVTFWC
jgi:hypothetical protein